MHKALEIQIEICCWKMDSDTHMDNSLNTEILKPIYTYVQASRPKCAYITILNS